MFRHRSPASRSAEVANHLPRRRRRTLTITPITVRRWLARHQRLYWLVIASLAWLAGSSAAAHTRRLDEAEQALSASVAVWVTTADIARGETVSAERQLIPVAFVPGAAVRTDPSNAVARHPIAQGELIVDTDVADDATHLVPDDWVIVAVVESPASGSGRGDPVQVASGGVVLADEAVVIEAGADRTLVAVPSDAGAMVATASRQGDVALLRLVDEIDEQ